VVSYGGPPLFCVLVLGGGDRPVPRTVQRKRRKRVDVLGDPLYITYMTPNEFFTLDNPQGRFILSGTAANVFSEMARQGTPETELVFGELVDVRNDLSAWLHQGR